MSEPASPSRREAESPTCSAALHGDVPDGCGPDFAERAPEDPPEKAGAPTCVPLLKIARGEELPHLCREGLSLLASLRPPVSVVTFLGDGRSGKSTLASKLVNEDRTIFPVGDTGAPVTEGIDMYVRQRDGGPGEGSLVIFDCEGGNSPTGALPTTVDLVAMFASTLHVQVVWGQMSEMQLQQIGHALASRDRSCSNLIDGVSMPPPAHNLLFVVNGCHLKYAPDYLSSALREVHGGVETSRNELRASIRRAYHHIYFRTVSPNHVAAYAGSLAALKTDIEQHCAPVECSGVQLSGFQVAEMLRSVVNELQTAGSVPVPSIFRYVIFDHLLVPLVDELLSRFERDMPDLSDEEYRSNLTDTRGEILRRFESATHQLTCKEFVKEAQQMLTKQMDTRWESISTWNTAVGEQIRDFTTEFDRRYSHSEERAIGFKKKFKLCGPKKPVLETFSVFHDWTRTRALKKNGTYDYTDWAASEDVSRISSSRSHSILSTSYPMSPRHQ